MASARTAPSAGRAPRDAEGGSGTSRAQGVPTPELGPICPQTKGKLARVALLQPQVPVLGQPLASAGAATAGAPAPWLSRSCLAGLPSPSPSATAVVNSHLPSFYFPLLAVALFSQAHSPRLLAPSPHLACVQSIPVCGADLWPPPVRFWHVPLPPPLTSKSRQWRSQPAHHTRGGTGKAFSFFSHPVAGFPVPAGGSRLRSGQGPGCASSWVGGVAAGPSWDVWEQRVCVAAASPPIRVSLADESPVSPAGRERARWPRPLWPLPGHQPTQTRKGVMKSPPGFRHGPCHELLLKRLVC